MTWFDGRLCGLRYAARSLSRTPGFTAIAALTLAVGVGASTTMFSIVYGVLLRPLPYSHADQLVLIQREEALTGAHHPVPTFFASPAEVEQWSARLHSFDSVAFYSTEVASLASSDGNEVIESAVVSPTFFSTLGSALTAGRSLEGADDSVPAVVVSERLARRLFGSPDDAIGQPVTLSSRVMTIVGVAGPELQFPAPKTDAWMPATFMRTVNLRCCNFRMLARLRPGLTVQAASAEVDAIATSGAGTEGGGHSHAVAVGMRDQLVGSVRPALLILFAAVGLLLVVAFTNLMSLVLAREVTRAREAAIRSALGASRGRLFWQALMESVLLAGAGAVLSIALAAATLSLVSWWRPPRLPRLDAVRIDAPVLIFSAVLALVAALGAAVLPAVKRTQTADVLKSGGAGSSGGSTGRRVRTALCAIQLAVSLVLLVGASLLGRSLVRLLSTDLGVSTDHVVTASLNLAFGRRPTDAEVVQRVGGIVAEIERVPGVRVAGVGTALPPAASRLRLTLRRTGDSVDYIASGVAATPGYFQALQMRLVKGRLFRAEDDLTHPPVMIMSVDTARRFFGDGDPIGRTMTLPVTRNGRNGPSEEMTLVGVIADVKYSGLDAVADDAVYRPFAQQTWVAPYLVVRTDGPPETLVATLRREIAAADRNVVVSDLHPLDSVVWSAAAQPRFRAGLLAIIAGLAVVIGAIGLYGVIAYSVSQRTREIGIRMALGARSGDVLTMILREGLGLVAVGMSAGLVAALAASRILRGLLYGIASTDVTSFALACVGLLAVATVATYLPARRATAIDPLVALRQE